jgi:hypothetical protein
MWRLLNIPGHDGHYVALHYAQMCLDEWHRGCPASMLGRM